MFLKCLNYFRKRVKHIKLIEKFNIILQESKGVTNIFVSNSDVSIYKTVVKLS